MRISDWSSDVCSSDLGAGCASFSPDTEMSRGRAPPAPKFFGAHREGPAVASAILESGGPGDRSVLLFRILPKPGCWHRQVIVSTGCCAPSRKTCRSFNEGTSVMEDPKIRIRLKAFDHRLIDRSAREIVETANRTGPQVRVPIPLPTKNRPYPNRPPPPPTKQP